MFDLLFSRPLGPDDDSASIDPELERWARRVIGELGSAPLLTPSHDLIAAVLLRLQTIAPNEEGTPSN
jgi:hypothetical protein